MLLGASTTPVFEQAETRLEPGNRLLLYTDGLMERLSESVGLGSERLARALVAHHTDEPGSPARCSRPCWRRNGATDVCVVDIRVPTDRA